MTTSIDLSLTPAQFEFLQLRCPYPMFHAGKGSGKSHLMGLVAVLYAQHSPNAYVGVYEPTHELLREIAIPIVEYWLQQFGLYPEKDYRLNQQHHTIKVLRPGWGDFLFKSYKEPATIIGYQTSVALVDELDTVSIEHAKYTWAQIDDRNRLQLLDGPEDHMVWSEKNKRNEYINRVMCFTSPEGFKFCYQTWKQLQKNNPSFQCVRGSMRDNPVISEAYIRERELTFTQDEIDSKIDGYFRNMTSGTVYNQYDREKHRSTETIQSGETLRIGVDFNVYNMAASVYVLRNGGKEWHLVDELHSVSDTPELCDLIKEKWKDKGHRIICYPDSSGGARKTTNAAISDLSILREYGFEVRAKSKNPEVKDRVAATNRAFADNIVFINDLKAHTAADCFEQQAYDKNGKPDKNNGHDHQNDASTYPIAYELPVRQQMYTVDFHFML